MTTLSEQAAPAALSTTSITTVNPATGEVLTTYPVSGDAGIDAAITASAAAQVDWAKLDLPTRGKVLTAAAAVLRRRVEELALLVTREMGKPLLESRAEVREMRDGRVSTTRSTPATSWPTSTSPPARTGPGSATNRSVSCSP